MYLRLTASPDAISYIWLHHDLSELLGIYIGMSRMPSGNARRILYISIPYYMVPEFITDQLPKYLSCSVVRQDFAN